jgi:hypothetical protein
LFAPALNSRCKTIWALFYAVVFIKTPIIVTNFTNCIIFNAALLTAKLAAVALIFLIVRLCSFGTKSQAFSAEPVWIVSRSTTQTGIRTALFAFTTRILTILTIRAILIFHWGFVKLASCNTNTGSYERLATFRITESTFSSTFTPEARRSAANTQVIIRLISPIRTASSQIVTL